MNKQDAEFQKKHPELYNSEVALKRAASKVWESARKSGRAVIYSKNGKIIKEYPAQKEEKVKSKHES